MTVGGEASVIVLNDWIPFEQMTLKGTLLHHLNSPFKRKNAPSNHKVTSVTPTSSETVGI